MANAKLVQEFLSPVVSLDTNLTVAEALSRLERANSGFGIVGDKKGKPLALVSLEQLHATDKSAPLLSLIMDVQRPIIVEASVTIDDAVTMLAKDLVLNPDLAGIVVQDRDRLQGVLPRRAIIEHTSRIVTRSTADRLEGAPVDALFFECPDDHERILVAYYDPQNPPLCSKGHLMRPVED